MSRSITALVAALVVTGACIADVVARGNPGTGAGSPAVTDSLSEQSPGPKHEARLLSTFEMTAVSEPGSAVSHAQPAVAARYDQHRRYYDEHRHGAFIVRYRE